MSKSPIFSQAAYSLTKFQNIKVVFVGESTVGKTSIINIANTGEFLETTPTVGACFLVNTYQINGRQIKLNLWDTAGQERYRSLTPIYFRDMDVGVLVYSIDNIESFNEIKKWHESIMNELNHKPELYLVGNKSDLEDVRVVSYEMGEKMANEINAKFFELSAKTDKKGVRKMIYTVAEEIAIRIDSLMVANNPPIERQKSPQQDGCCD
ncbi:Ras-related protein Rab-6.1 [Tritrichomonas foetus]|uniref:Ras-related protein Rab-6.1 n=1 Tax=Tritrichomonas foetus TaxID=1144522 RepID=A0A1J4J8A1_9EUKA|nr:Ras-related protein Rab-6.1 [Tritrichomonas foetus]|eukprot:OHS93629.1 Ras-related protein Rab-6.1 [Tritrichomonas foetus]